MVSTAEIARTHSSSQNQPEKAIHTAQLIQVDENDPILNKAKKLDHLCTNNRDFFLLQSDAVTADEYAKISLGSEQTDDSHVQQLSLPHCDDSLSTTVSEESDCTSAVRVYDLNKRETKILRHDIIKRSRNPIGGTAINSIDNLGNCCSDTNATVAKDRSESPLQTTIQQFNSRILENVHETRKPPRSPNKLRSVHLNRNPRKLKMSDVQLMNDAFGTSLDPKIVDEIKRRNIDVVDNMEIMIVVNDTQNDIVTETEKLLESERESSKISVVENVVAVDETEYLESSDNKQPADESTVISDCVQHQLVNDCANVDDNNDNNHDLNEKNSEIALNQNNFIEINSEQIVLTPSFKKDETDDQVTESISTEQIQRQISNNSERNYDVIVQVNEHKEKSVIEEDVISALPSVKALARTFSTKINTDVRPEKLHRPKVSLNFIFKFIKKYNSFNPKKHNYY